MQQQQHNQQNKRLDTPTKSTWHCTNRGRLKVYECSLQRRSQYETVIIHIKEYSVELQLQYRFSFFFLFFYKKK